MSSFAKKFNKQRLFDVDTNGFEYFKLSDLYQKNGAECQYMVRAIYINTKSAFGNAPIIATDSFFVNLPTYMLSTAREILDDDESVEQIKAGKVAFVIREYMQKKFNRVCYGINFVDVNTSENHDER